MIKKYVVHYIDKNDILRRFSTFAKSEFGAEANLIKKGILFSKICKTVLA